MILPFEVQKEVYDFFEDISLYGYNCDFIELTSPQAQINYENILKKLLIAKLPCFQDLEFHSLSLGELIRYLSELFSQIFNQKYDEEVKSYNSLLRLVDIENPFDAMIETTYSASTQKPVNIFISNKVFSIQVVSTAHEYIHALLSKYDTGLFNKKINNIHYKELLPIIIEYMICFELSKILPSENLNRQHELIRIYHDHEQAKERLDCLRIRPHLNSFSPLDASMLESYIAYQTHNPFSYIISDLYAIYLLEIYKDSKNALIKIITEIISGDKCINDLIAYFNLSLKNPASYLNMRKQSTEV